MEHYLASDGEMINANVVYFEIDNIIEFSKAVDSMQKVLGIKFIYVKCSYDDEMPRPPIEKVINFEFW